MSKIYIEDKLFKSVDFSETELTKGDYERCSFANCVFLNVDLSAINFVECTFEHCDLSMAKLANTGFRDVRFKSCRLLGLHFEDCNDFLFSVAFENCQLNLSSFYQKTLKVTVFKGCNLQEVDFTEADLTNVIFEHCDLSKAIFAQTKLENTDFRTSYHFSIDPAINYIKKAKFSLEGLKGLLDKYDIVVE
ncbi:MAG: pentapeptide repeat-containing protein [Saprospiraceae bacterium]|nr:pentapeptide repeat-containing protein [Saprospiraceae bacterium]